MSVFKIENVSYTYDKKDELVLDKVNFLFEKEKLYAIFGKSGSGKTTLLSLMAGLDIPTYGKILYNGKDISKMNAEEYRSKNVGVIFQNFNLLPHLTALENILLSIDISGIKEKNKKEKSIKLLQKVGLSEQNIYRKVLQLSAGEQQCVTIARALSFEPDVILADEPTCNLDSKTEQQVMNLFKSLVSIDKKCVILVTHSPSITKDVDIVYNLVKNNKEEVNAYK